MLKQIIPNDICLSCNICCRYTERTTAYAPCFLKSEIKDDDACIGKSIDTKPPPIPYKDSYICRFFLPDTNSCQVYQDRPLDCRLYPFMVSYSKDYKSVILALDRHCPYLKERRGTKEYAEYVAATLEESYFVEKININKSFINDFQENSTPIKKLKNLSKALCLSGYGLRRISLKDKPLFDKYFSKAGVSMSSFSFAAIYIWSGILNILWKEIDNSLCVFAGNNKDYFLLLPPTGAAFSRRSLKESFDILKGLNKGGMPTLNVENIPEKFHKKFDSTQTSCEYIYIRKVLSDLKGEKFKTKRKSVNNFIKKYRYLCRPLVKGDIFNCLDLYKAWARQRLKNQRDEYYRFLIEDSCFAQKTALYNFEALGLRGLTVEIDGVIRGYTAGYELNKDTFVILFETTDLNIKGLAQFIFKEFCLQLSGYKYINVMSDSGLENLKKIKESYRPVKKIPIFTARLD